MVRRRKSGLNQGHQSIEGVKNNGRRGTGGGSKERNENRQKKKKKVQWQIGGVCCEFPFRFKAACSLSSYLSRVIYFLISLSLPSLPFSLSLSVWIYLVVTWKEEGKEEEVKVNKSLWRQLFPPSLSCLFWALSPLLLLSIYLRKLLCFIAFPALLASFPVRASLSCNRTARLYLTAPYRGLLILFFTRTASPMSPNHEIRKAVCPAFGTHLNDVSRESGKSTGPWGATISELKSKSKLGQ